MSEFCSRKRRKTLFCGAKVIISLGIANFSALQLRKIVLLEHNGTIIWIGISMEMNLNGNKMGAREKFLGQNL